jgi:hypothetical protein
MKKQLLLFPALFIACILLTNQGNAQQKIGDNPTTINAGSVLELESTNKGLLMPRVTLTTTTTWGLAGTATAGMTVYNTAAGITSTNTSYPANGIGEYFWDGTGWVSKKAGAQAINNGLLDQISVSAQDGSTVQFIIPVDVLIPSDSLRITYSFYTTNPAGASNFYLVVPTISTTNLGGTGPCGGGSPGGFIHSTIKILRPTAPDGMVVFAMTPNTNPGCQGQTIYLPNIVVRAAD